MYPFEKELKKYRQNITVGEYWCYYNIFHELLTGKIIGIIDDHKVIIYTQKGRCLMNKNLLYPKSLLSINSFLK